MKVIPEEISEETPGIFRNDKFTLKMKYLVQIINDIYLKALFSKGKILKRKYIPTFLAINIHLSKIYAFQLIILTYNVLFHFR